MSIEQAIADLTTATNSLTAASTNLINTVPAAAATAAAPVATSAGAAAGATAGTAAGTAAAQAAISAAQPTIAASVLAASTSATGAATSASAASTSNTTAQGFATAAGTSATGASTSATSAAASAALVAPDPGVTSASLHRSPNAVIAMHILDTTRDSDGGAWTDRQQTSGWYNETLNGTWRGACASETVCRAITGAATGDFFQLTTDGKCYALVASSGIVEVFRGNKAAFPRLVAGVLEAGTYTMYDLTDSTRSMWMRFNIATSNAVQVGTPTCVSMLNGILMIGGTLGLARIHFNADYATFTNATFRYVYRGDLSTRNSTLGFDASAGVVLIGPSVLSLSPVVLPDAPTVPATAMPVATVAVMTTAGVSVLRHDASVCSHALTLTAADSLAVSTLGVLYYSNLSATTSGYRFQRLSALSGTTFAGTAVGTTPLTLSAVTAMRAMRNGAIVGALSTGEARVGIYRQNEGTPTGVLNARISGTYASGFLVGDIRRAYLADIVTGAQSGAVSDRSYKAASAALTGAITKTAVATGAQLVAYSGWSTANYLQEPYSADLDFGTGTWSVAAWVNTVAVLPSNLLTQSEFPNGLSDSPTHGSAVTAATIAWGGFTAGIAFSTTGNANNYAYKALAALSSASTGVFSVFVKFDDGNAPTFGSSDGTSSTNDFVLVVTGAVTPPLNYTVTSMGGGVYRVSSSSVAIAAAGGNTGIAKYAANSTRTFVVTGYSVCLGSLSAYAKTTTTAISGLSILADRSAASGPSIRVGMNGGGFITATAYDGTTTRTVTAPAASNTGLPVSAAVNYRADGSLAMVIGDIEVARTTGTPLLTMSNAAAVLTMGINRTLDSPFTGSLALVKWSATVATPEQTSWIYGMEKGMFRAGVQVALPATSLVTDLSYDDVADRWTAVQGTIESAWTGLVRIASATPAAGAFTGVSTRGGTRLLARSASSPGVDISTPPLIARIEFAKRLSVANLKPVIVDFDTTYFTGTTTASSPSVTAVVVGAGVPVVGMTVAGVGIPASTTITAISGTTYTLSANATAAGTLVSIYQPQTDFVQGCGYAASDIEVNGVRVREGSTRTWARIFDGFVETIRFGTAQGANCWVQIHATKDNA